MISFELIFSLIPDPQSTDVKLMLRAVVPSEQEVDFKSHSDSDAKREWKFWSMNKYE